MQSTLIAKLQQTRKMLLLLVCCCLLQFPTQQRKDGGLMRPKSGNFSLGPVLSDLGL